MSKRKFGFEGFGINRQATYNFERSQAPQRLYVPPSSRSSGGHDNYEDTDLDNIEYDDRDAAIDADSDRNNGNDAVENDEIDPLDAFMAGIHEEMMAPPPPKLNDDRLDKYKEEDEEDDPMETFLKSKKDVGLQLAAQALQAGYNSDEEVYAAAKAVDAGLVEYDSDDNPIVVDKRKIEPIPALDHTSIDYEPFNKDFYDEKPSISGTRGAPLHQYSNVLCWAPQFFALLGGVDTVLTRLIWFNSFSMVKLAQHKKLLVTPNWFSLLLTWYACIPVVL